MSDGWLRLAAFGREKWVTFTLASAIHAGILAGGDAAFVHAPRYGVESGFAGSEIELVDAPVSPEAPQAAEAPGPETKPGPDAVLIPDKKEDAKPKPAAPSVGSGAFTQAEPGYRRNPAPAYPEEARRSLQEGVVVLSVEVSGQGRPANVTVKASSGFPLLDEAALEAVRRWVFSPARVGSLAVSSRVEIPIRFELED